LHLETSESVKQKSSENTQNSNTTNESVKIPQSSEDLLARDNDNPVNITAPVALPPKYGDTPQSKQHAGSAYMPNGMPVLQPMKGVNVDTLFSKELKDSNKRFDRVENAVIDLRKEFESLKPSMVRLAAVESDIQNLITELEVMLQETPTPQKHITSSGAVESEADLSINQLPIDPRPPPNVGAPKTESTSASTPPKSANKVPAVPPAKESKPAPKAPAPVKKYDGVVATELRIGEHSDKVRVVIDANVQTDFTIDYDKDENLITVELPNARWVGDLQKSLSDSKLIKSWSVTSINNDKGSLVVMTLKKSSSILLQKRLSPDNTSHYHRIYFDLSL